ncbi:MAG: PAS domain S-box protein, partial [Chloroflexota bacterium]
LSLLYEATSDIHRAVVRATSEAELWAEASRIIVEVAGFPLAWVGLAVEGASTVTLAAAAGTTDYLDGRVDDLRSADPTPVVQALRDGRTVVLDDLMGAGSGPYAERAIAYGFRSGAAVPMHDADGRPFGALMVLDRRPSALSGERVALLERLAADLVVARALVRTSARLRASEERFRSIVEQASAGIIVFDAHGTVLDANPAACAMVGYALDELRAVGPDLVLRDLSPDEEAGLRDVLGSGAALWVDRRFRRKDGEVITVAFQGRRREDGAIEAVIQDVTAERRALAALQASEARYRDLVGVLQEGIITYDGQGRVTSMNETARRMHGPAAPDPTGRHARTLAQHFIGEDGKPLDPELLPTQIALRTGRPTERLIIGIPQPDGSVRWVSSNAVPTGLDAAGRPSGIVVSFSDVTELREAIARAQASEDRVTTLVEEAFDGVIVCDEDGVISYANPASALILSVPREALVGQSLYEIIPRDHRERLGRDLALVASGKVFEGEYLAVRSDGAELAVEVTGSRLADGRIEIIARNVTARKVLEAERDRLAQAAEQASDAIYITDAEGTISYVNRAYERINGYLRGEAVGRTAEVHLGPESAAVEAQIAEALKAGGVWAGEVMHRAKDGTRFRVSCRAVALRDPGGRVTGRVVIARDISLEREQDARLAQAARLEAIAQLAGGVAHDLNNVLTMIVGHAALLDPLTATPADIAEGVRAITAAAGQAEGLTTRLLAFGRRAFLQPRPADLRDLLADTQPLLARAVGARVALVVSPGVEPTPVNLDPNLFEQALLAIVVHARDRMPDGGTLRLAIERPAAGETLPGVEAAVLVLSDTGAGLTPEALDRLFEPFASVGDDEPGLGLAMAHGFVEQSGGRVDVSTSSGFGTTFRILLPLARPEAEPAKPEPAGQPERSGPATILVADDEAVLRQVAHRTLTARGYIVLLAGSGEEALAVASAYDGRIDLLFSDVVMPGLRGPGLAAALVRTRPDMRVLLTSGYAEDVIGRRGIESIAGEFLPKPYTPSMLAATVEELLGRDR